MRINVGLDNELELTEVYNPIILRTDSGEILAITMRDSGFEFKYQGRWYSAKQGIVESFEDIAERSRSDISTAQSDGEAELNNTNK